MKRWAARQRSTNPLKARSVLRFDFPLFGHNENGDFIFVRPCYVSLAEDVLISYGSQSEPNAVKARKALRLIGKPQDNRDDNEVFHRTEKHPTTIIGNPGIGKTHFIGYLAAVCVSAGIPFQYYGSKDNEVKALKGSVSIDADMNIQPANEWVPQAAEDWISAYDHDPPGISAKFARPEMGHCVFTSSPNATRLKEWEKPLGDVMIMPVWGLKNILDYRKRCLPELSRDVVEELFYRYGGVIRYVVQKPLRLTRQNTQIEEGSLIEKASQQLYQAIKSCKGKDNLNQMMNDVEQTDANDTSHRLFHYVRKSDNSHGRLEEEYTHFVKADSKTVLASEFVLHELVDKMGVLLCDEDWFFRSLIDQDWTFSTAAGKIFETRVHSQFTKKRPNAKKFAGQIRMLSRPGKETSEFHFPTLRKKMFPDVDKLEDLFSTSEDLENFYFVPWKSNQSTSGGTTIPVA